MFERILFEAEDVTAWITLNRTDKKNALDFVVIKELKEALQMVADNPEIRFVVLRAAGDTFSAGLDMVYLKKLQEYSIQENLYDCTHLMELYEQMLSLTKLIFCMVEGPAIASGCGLVLASDLVFASPAARFAFREVKYGYLPAMVTALLVRRISGGKARELLLTGDWVEAQQAQEMGLVNYLLEDETDPAEQLRSFVDRIQRENSQGAMELTKKLILDLNDLPFKDGLNFAARMTARARESHECRFGTDCFINREPFQWT